MPRNSQGDFTLPSGTLVTSGETIAPSQHNPPFQDVAQALTGSLSRDGQGGMRAALGMGGNPIQNLQPGVQNTDAATVGQIAAVTGTPAGAVIDFAGSVAPAGWLICAGQTLSRASFASLFAAIGTTYGAPSGSTFNLPDTRGRVSAGRDVDQDGFAGRLTTPNSQTLGAAGGAQTVALTLAQLAAHTHPVSGTTSASGDHTHPIAIEGGSPGPTNRVSAFPTIAGGTMNTLAGGDHTHTLAGTATSTGSGEAHPNVQPTIIFTKIIKT